MDENIALARDRMLTYQLLSSLYLQEASTDLLALMSQSASLQDGKLGEYISGLSAASLEEARVDAAADFAALFLGMSANPVAPYESVYTSEEHLLMQDARDEVLAVYRQEGLGYAGADNLPEDHIGTEFEFMAKLCQKEVAALEAGDTPEVQRLRDIQRAFITEHLAVWVPGFCDDVEARARTLLYGGLAQITRQLVASEAEWAR